MLPGYHSLLHGSHVYAVQMRVAHMQGPVVGDNLVVDAGVVFTFYDWGI